MISLTYAVRLVFGTRDGIRRFLGHLLVAFGLVSAVVQFVGLLFQLRFPAPLLFIAASLGGCAAWAIVQTYPRRVIDHRLSHPSVKISIEIGDLFTTDDCHLVVGFTDTFDTSTVDDVVIDRRTVQGQLLTELYSGEPRRLDRELRAALDSVSPVAVESRGAKRLGKLSRYPIGTVAVLGGPQRRVFGLAYSRMDNNLVARSSIDDLWFSLSRLWNTIDAHGHRRTVAMPVIGSGLSRVDALNYESLLRMIVLSFVAHSRRSMIVPALRIFVAPTDLSKINLLAASAFLRSM